MIFPGVATQSGAGSSRESTLTEEDVDAVRRRLRGGLRLSVSRTGGQVVAGT